jgi:hypothetical protein
MKKYLIFSGAGNSEQQFYSWYCKESPIYDRALNYYGDDSNLSQEYQSYNPEFYFEGKGMIFENLIKHYDNFKEYEYILVVDSDLELDPKQLEHTFQIATNQNMSGCTWSRTPGGYGYFNELYETTGTDNIFPTNFMEMNFMLLKNTLLKKVIEKIKPYNLKWFTGIDQFIPAVAYNERMWPLYFIDKYHFYNPHPKNKEGRREIDVGTGASFETRYKPMFNIFINNPKYFKISKNTYLRGKSLKNDLTPFFK